MFYGLEIHVAYIFWGLEEAVYWIKKKIFQETVDDTLKEETLAGRNFRGFAVFSQIRENFQKTSSAKVSSREIF